MPLSNNHASIDGIVREGLTCSRSIHSNRTLWEDSLSCSLSVTIFIFMFINSTIKPVRLPVIVRIQMIIGWPLPSRYFYSASSSPLLLRGVLGQNGSGQNGTDKMVWTKWYWTKWYGWNIMCKVINQSRSHWKYNYFFINSASTLTPLAFLHVLIIYL